MTKCILGILVSLLLLLPASELDHSPAEPFPRGEDGFGRPVWYNPMEGGCEDLEDRRVMCPEFLIKKPE